MSVVVCRTPAFPVESWMAPPTGAAPAAAPERFDVWSAIQSQKAAADPLPAPYVHPLVRRSSSSLSQKSLEICTESLGSETGSDIFSSSGSDDDIGFLPSCFFSGVDEMMNTEAEREEEEEEKKKHEEEEEEEGEEEYEKKELVVVNYHCSISRRSPRSFPPPLPSISRRDGPCLSMRPHRRDGRLVVEAVHVPSQNYLHAERHGGRLLLSFINTSSREIRPGSNAQPPEKTEQAETDAKVAALKAETEEKSLAGEEDEEEVEVEEEEEEEVEEEEVEVVDRGTVVEVKVSTQPQPQSGAMKVRRSSLVINKFVGGTPTAASDDSPPPLRRVPSTTTTAAAAAVAASSLSATTSSGESSAAAGGELLFASRSKNREELLHHMRRCSQLRRPLFFWEPCCIATSS